MVQDTSKDSIVCHIYFNTLTMKTDPWLGLQELLVPPQSLAPQLAPLSQGAFLYIQEVPLQSAKRSVTHCCHLVDICLQQGHQATLILKRDKLTVPESEGDSLIDIQSTTGQHIKSSFTCNPLEPSCSNTPLCGGRAWSKDSCSLY